VLLAVYDTKPYGPFFFCCLAQNLAKQLAGSDLDLRCLNLFALSVDTSG